MTLRSCWGVLPPGLPDLPSADYRENGKDIVFRKAGREFGVSRIEHQHTDFFPVDCKRVDNIAYRYVFANLTILLFETIIAK